LHFAIETVAVVVGPELDLFLELHDGLATSQCRYALASTHDYHTFAVGHHVFYRSLDQLSVDENLFNQQTNIAIGTAFAFLFRANLVLATCTAYWQVFWATALRNTLTISNMDALAGVLGSLLDFASVKTFFRNPGLAILALLAWIVPFASLLPPATLSVQPAAMTNNTQIPVPVPYFADYAMAAITYRAVAGDKFSGVPGGLESTMIEMYLKPTLQLSRLATTTAYRGAIPDHRTSLPNSTYQLEFQAPALQCQPMTVDVLSGFNGAAGCNFTRSSGVPERRCDEVVPYVSWVPDRSSLVPFGNGTVKNGFLPLDTALQSLKPNVEYSKSYMGYYENGPSSLFVATRNDPGPGHASWNVLNCSLFNASYTVHESSDSNSRSQSLLSDVRMLNSVPFRDDIVHKFSETRNATQATVFSYQALMESFNRLLVGSMVSSAGTYPQSQYWAGPDMRSQNPNVMSTLLAFSNELVRFLSDTRTTGYSPLAEDPLMTTVQEIDKAFITLPKEALESPSYNQSLALALEELFQNLTLALFSDARFLRDSEQPVNITVAYTRNIYTYSSRNLLISYGAALSLTILACLAGCLAIFFNRASYTNKFSTIMRTTAGFEYLVHENDRTGADPLPKHLAKSRIHIGHREGAADGMRSSHEATGERRAMMDRDRQGPKAPEVVSQRSVSPIT
jgi:hypothetical protein